MGRKKAKELSALEVSRLITPGLHFVGGVTGLALQVTSPTARSLILRIPVGGKRTDIGLGRYPSVMLAGAKDAARVDRDKVRTPRSTWQPARSSAKCIAGTARSTFDTS
jgi:hypothetical protein